MSFVGELSFDIGCLFVILIVDWIGVSCLTSSLGIEFFSLVILVFSRDSFLVLVVVKEGVRIGLGIPSFTVGLSITSSVFNGNEDFDLIFLETFFSLSVIILFALLSSFDSPL